MKKNILLVLIFFTIINFVLFFTLNIHIYINEYSSDVISFTVPNGYYFIKKYDKNSNKINMYDNDGNAITIMLVNQLLSNESLYTNEQIANGINYQIMKEFNGYKVLESKEIKNGYFIKNSYKNSYVENIIKFIDSKILVISYYSKADNYDKGLINELGDSVKVI